MQRNLISKVFYSLCFSLLANTVWADEQITSPPQQDLPLANEIDAAGFPPIDAFDGIVQRPLFHASRRPKADQETEAGSNAEILETWRLTGVVFNDEGAPVALFAQRQGEEKLRLTQGMPLDSGWDVSVIAADHVVVSNVDEEVRFDLWEPRPAAPPEPPQDRRRIIREALDEKLEEKEQQPGSGSTGDEINEK